MKKCHIHLQGLDVFVLFLCTDEDDPDPIGIVFTSLFEAMDRGHPLDISEFFSVLPEELFYRGVGYEVLAVPMVGDVDYVRETLEDNGFEFVAKESFDDSSEEVESFEFWQIVKEGIEQEQAA